MASTEKVKRWLITFGVSANLMLLFFFKYFNFFVTSLANAFAALGVRVDLPLLELTLPIAISFLTFHGISYIVDVYRGVIRPTRSLVDMLLYISFFPHLVAGPIVRAAEFLPQAIMASNPASIRLGRSTFLILGGVFKKVIVANYLATNFVDPVFVAPESFGSLDLLLAAYAYAIQIYCDFSGYTDIAIGIANLLGYRFPDNFNQPYRALSIQDFWRRWHMTLSRWLRDYLYIPLGGNRGSEAKTYRNLIVTMVLGGLWHGASFNFMIWGAIHGAALVLERSFGVGKAGVFTGDLRKCIQWFVTFHVVCASWIFFRAPSLDAALAYYQTLLSGSGHGTTMTPFVALLLFVGALTQAVPSRYYEQLEEAFDSMPMLGKIAISFGSIYFIAVCAPGGIPPFIYFQF